MSRGPAQPAAAGTAVAARPPREKTQVELFGDAITLRKNGYAAVLPKHTSADRFIRSAMIAVSREPKLLNCDPTTMFAALQQAASLGLEVSGMLGSAYLIPYGSAVQLIPGYRGLIALARQSGEITSIDAFVVRANDKFHVRLGTDPKIEHEPALDGELGDPRLFYAVATFREGGEKQFAVMTKAEVDAIRKRSKAGGSGPWVTDYVEMGKKTVIRRLMKYLPMSVEKLARAMELDTAADEGKAPPPETIDATAFASMVSDSRAAENAAGAPGAVDKAIAATETATRQPGEEPAEDIPYDPNQPLPGEGS